MIEKVRPPHLERKAILYIRQSSAYQVTHNLESPKLQYAMQERLRSMGWREIEVIDEDLGCSASGTVIRSGFERMVAEVCLGKAGAVAAREVSRFARNSREWQQLVEVCRVVDTLLVDHETIYDPRQSNDRLLLGLKGSLNEYELDLLRQRSLEARRQKARRGELIVCAPVGYVKTENGRLEKDPDRRVQEAVLSVFSKFLQLGSIRQTLMWFLEHDLQLPVKTAEGDICWKRPYYGTLYRILTNPAYGGAYAYGKSEPVTHYENGEARHGVRRKAKDQWLALIPDIHEGYVSWSKFEQVQREIGGNVRTAEQSGAAQNGSAILSGLLRCQRCGRKLTVIYTGRDHNVVRYGCRRGWLDSGEPKCIAFGGTSMDEAIGDQVLRVVEPAAVESAMLAHEEELRKQDEVLNALRRDLEAARYAADRAHKQYDRADPENRLVADELERRWNQALEQVRKLEERIGRHTQGPSQTAELQASEFFDLAADLEAIWHCQETDVRLKKRIVRTLIEEIVVDVSPEAGEIIAVIHWKGGLHTELRLPRRRRGQNCSHTPKEIVDAVKMLALTCSDEVIAGALNRNDLRTGRGNRWTRELVTSLRSGHQIPCFSRNRQESEGWMNLTAAARFLGVSSRTLRLAAKQGEIQGEHPLSDGPWVFSRANLQSETAVRFTRRVRTGRDTTDQQNQTQLFNHIAR